MVLLRLFSLEQLFRNVKITREINAQQLGDMVCVGACVLKCIWAGLAHDDDATGCSDCADRHRGGVLWQALSNCLMCIYNFASGLGL